MTEQNDASGRLRALIDRIPDSTHATCAKVDLEEVLAELADAHHRLANPCDGTDCENGGAAHCHTCPEAESDRLIAERDQLRAELADARQQLAAARCPYEPPCWTCEPATSGSPTHIARPGSRLVGEWTEADKETT